MQRPNEFPTLQAKADRYATLTIEIAAVLAGETDLTARMATVAAMLMATFEAFSWTGFYRVDPQDPHQLVVGPYQGPMGCLRIEFGRGVCGASALRGETIVVADVDEFPGHIACDSRSRSEIVTPVRDPAGALIAVLDIDSNQLNAFDSVDAAALEMIVRSAFAG